MTNWISTHTTIFAIFKKMPFVCLKIRWVCWSALPHTPWPFLTFILKELKLVKVLSISHATAPDPPKSIPSYDVPKSIWLTENLVSSLEWDSKLPLPPASQIWRSRYIRCFYKGMQEMARGTTIVWIQLSSLSLVRRLLDCRRTGHTFRLHRLERLPSSVATLFSVAGLLRTRLTTRFCGSSEMLLRKLK